VALFRRGDRDVAIDEIRAKLIHIGFPLESSDSSFFDDRLDEAVRSFQQARGLTVDGIVGPQTLQRIEEARWKLGDRTLSFVPGHLIHGEDVVSLQQRLSTMGFDCGKVDGIFGSRTDKALREFQRSVGVTDDGTAARETFDALQRLVRTVSGGRAEKLRQSLLLDSLRTGIADKTIVIDPGHGGIDTGIDAHNVRESEIVSMIANRLQGRLAALGATVVLTRPLQVASNPSDRERADLCNKVNADLVISIHCDAATSENASGISTFHFGSETGGWSHSGERAAQRIHQAVLERTQANDCNIHARTWDLLRMTRMPAVTIDVGYITNQDEAAALTDKKYLDDIAAGIADGAVTFFAPVED
jgi:N-acetylmuramoyl-L-alanine amidase